RALAADVPGVGVSTATSSRRLLDHAEPAVVAAHVPEPAVGIHDHLADPDVPGRQREHAKLIGLRIEPYDGVRLDLVGPHRAGPIDGDRVRATVRARRQRVLLDDLPRDGIDADELAVAVLGDPER